MVNFLKKRHEIVLFLLVIIFLGSLFFLFIKVIDFLVVNLNTALSIPDTPKTSVKFNINDAILILKQRQLIQ